MKTTKVFGSPGTGKTTFLLNIVEQALENNVRSNFIGYFSFTRKAADEARDRAIKKFPYLHPKNDFPHFRTLHSLAFRCLNLRTELIMQEENFHEFAAEAGITVTVVNEGDEISRRADNPIMNEIHLARIKGRDLKQHYNESKLDIEWHHFEFVERTYRHYKQSRNLVDFTDMLELVIQQPELLPELDLLIIDEAQDLSRLQWDLVKALVDRCGQAYLAGDDDQAVFTWSGADVQAFLDFPGDVLVLNQSYRIPAKVHSLANNIVKRIKNRQPKTWSPRDYEGSIQTYSRFEDIAITSDDSWLVLAATNYMLNPVHEVFKANGILFERSGVPSMALNMLKAVSSWERLRRGQRVGFEEVKNIFRYMDTGMFDYKNRSFKTGNESATYDLQELLKDHGLYDSPVWHEALLKIGEEYRIYLTAVLRRGTKLSSVSRIQLSTIHGAKGGEADHVILLMDLGPKFTKAYKENPDDVQRMFYVAVTRAKKSLHLVLPKRADQGFTL